MKNKNEIPEFNYTEEERHYWESRGPLAEGYKGKINKPKLGQKRSSYLAVRLTGEEITQLRDLAMEQGMGPSTYARNLITWAINSKKKIQEPITLDQLVSIALGNLAHSEKEWLDAFYKSKVIGDFDSPLLLEFSGSEIEWRKAIEMLFRPLLSAYQKYICVGEPVANASVEGR